MPVEWKQEGDTTTVTRVQKYRVDIHDMHSIENLPLPLFKAMNERDEIDTAAEEAAIEDAKQGD